MRRSLLCLSLFLLFLISIGCGEEPTSDVALEFAGSETSAPIENNQSTNPVSRENQDAWTNLESNEDGNDESIPILVEEEDTTTPGDDDPSPGPGGDDNTISSFECTPIGASLGDGFFFMTSFKEKLYAGQFGYGLEASGMLYEYPNWKMTQPGITGVGESICAMAQFDGYLYANTENSGDIFRSTNGSDWSLVYNGPPASIGCGMAVFGDELYAINYSNGASNHGRILRQDGDAWTLVYDSGDESLYIRDIVSYDGVLYAFAALNEQGWMLTSTNGSDWSAQPTSNRYFRSHVWNDYLWLSSTDMYANGEVGIFRFDGSAMVQVHASDQRYITQIKDLDGNLFAGSSNGWKDESGPSTLLYSQDDGDTWETICTFNETAAWTLEVHNGSLYVGTWDFGQGGYVYRVDPGEIPAGTNPDPTPSTVDCGPIAAHPAWELCESTTTSCAGVFTDGAGCAAFCAAAGLTPTSCFGGEPGCQKEPGYPLSCNANSGHTSDWCECGDSGGSTNIPDPPPDVDVNCGNISTANPAWEVCETSNSTCSGVFTDGAGCIAFCAAAGLVCTAQFGGEPGCQKEPQNVLSCNSGNGHQSDWCECGVGPGGNLPIDEGGGNDLNCPSTPGNLPYQMEMDFHQASYTQNHNWVHDCYPNAYTAGNTEHQACDGDYFPDGSRTGSAIYTFNNVPPGSYEVYVGGRHTDNRNPSGARFVVDGHVKLISQKDTSGDYIWDYHGTYCLEGTVEVILDSTVNSGSDSTFGARLVPAP